MPDLNEEPLSKINRRCAERPMPHNTTDFLGNSIGSWPRLAAATERLSLVAPVSDLCVKQSRTEAFRRRACGIVAGAELQSAENTTRISQLNAMFWLE
jgi:hypothetical protein